MCRISKALGEATHPTRATSPPPAHRPGEQLGGFAAPVIAFAAGFDHFPGKPLTLGALTRRRWALDRSPARHECGRDVNALYWRTAIVAMLTFSASFIAAAALAQFVIHV